MSRYLVGASGIVGWDNPLGSFFWMSRDANGKIERESELGYPGKEITSVDQLIAEAPFTIPADMQQTLQKDKSTSAGPSPLQKRMRDLFATMALLDD